MVGAPRVLFTPLRFLLGKSVMAGMEINNKRDFVRVPSACPWGKKNIPKTFLSLRHQLHLSFILSTPLKTNTLVLPAENQMNQWWISNLLFNFFVCANRRWKRETDVTCSTKSSWIESNVFWGGRWSSCRNNLNSWALDRRLLARWINEEAIRYLNAPFLLPFHRHRHWPHPSHPKPVLLPTTVIIQN